MRNSGLISEIRLRPKIITSSHFFRLIFFGVVLFVSSSPNTKQLFTHLNLCLFTISILCDFFRGHVTVLNDGLFFALWLLVFCLLAFLWCC